jgi:exonuclease SbcC
MLDDKKTEVEAKNTLLERQKKAVREVNPAYISWQKKHREALLTKENIAKKTIECEAALKAFEEAARKSEEAESRRSEADDLKLEIDKIKGDFAKYKERDDAKAALEKLEAELQKLEEQEKAHAVAKAALDEKIDMLGRRVSELKEKPEELINAKNYAKEIERTGGKLKDILEEQLPKLSDMNENLAVCQQSLIAAQEKYDGVRAARQKAERGLENCRAGLLAATLREGEKCPVCGSVHHPEPASLPDNVVTEDEFKELQRYENELLEKKNNAQAAAEAACARREQYENAVKENVREALRDYGKNILGSAGCPDMTDVVAAAKAAYEDIKKRYKENIILQKSLEKSCREKETTEETLERAKGAETEMLDAQKDALVKRLTDNKTETAAVRATQEHLESLAYPDLVTAQVESEKKQERLGAINSLISKAAEEKEKTAARHTELCAALKTLGEAQERESGEEKDLRAALDVALSDKGFATDEEMLQFIVSESELKVSDEMIREYEQKVATNEVRLKQAKKDAAGKEWIDAEALKETYGQQKTIVDKKSSHINDIKNRMSVNRERKANINAQKEKYEAAKKEYGCCRRLYDLVKGTTGNAKITLEQYVQAAGFDNIIAAANRRLLPMSDGQFELYRKEDASGRKTNTFLDLEVLDNYTGHRRPVGNLSGGESFKASLSLALGLSDTVSSHLGGIQMDALFVDEGFGTLDKKSIDNAMEILLGLSGANKLVGVISHREELVENIPQQIKVKKTRSGSEFTVETGI